MGELYERISGYAGPTSDKDIPARYPPVPYTTEQVAELVEAAKEIVKMNCDLGGRLEETLSPFSTPPKEEE